MKKFLFKLLSITLILTYLSAVCLKDASFAHAAENASPGQETTSATSADSQGSSSQVEPQANLSSEGGPSSRARTGSSPIPPLQFMGSVSGFNLGALQSFQADPFTGKATFSIPIVVPQGRRGLQPNLTLTYGSGSGNGLLGVGWSLELGSIERSTKKGPPKYDSTDIFVFNSAGASQELVNINGQEYRSKIEGAFTKFVFNGDWWVATDKSGTKYYFGQSPSSQLHLANKVFRWCLNTVMDIHGNYLAISYKEDNSQVYPLSITYTYHDKLPASPLTRVEFLWEQRPDTNLSYRAGFGVLTNFRLSGLEVFFNETLIKTYVFEYQLSSTNRSLLSSVRQLGADNTTAFPPISFTYNNLTPGWSLSERTLSGNLGFADYVRVLDINNDGFADILKYIDGEGITALNNRNLSWSENSSLWKLPVYFGRLQGGNWYDNGIQLADVNADGWQDILVHIHNASGSCQEKRVYLNDRKSSWVEDSFWSSQLPEEVVFVTDHNGQWKEHLGWLSVDLNGDGLADFVRARANEYSSYTNTGSGWQRSGSPDMPAGDFTNGSTHLCDLNGDGLLDFFIVDGANSRAYLNAGERYLPNSSYHINLSDIPLQSIQLCDVNSDALADIVIASSSIHRTYINTSSGWQERSEFSLPEGDFSNRSSRLADTRGRIFSDILINQPSSGRKIYTSNNTSFPDLLTKISNGIGGEIQITYQPSTEFDNTAGDGISDLPFPVYVVDRVTTFDTVNPNNPALVTRYEYKDGLFDFTEREFRGFGYVKVIDAEGNFTETYFNQDEIYKGRPYKQETKDKDANLYSKVENTWQYTQVHPGVYFPYLAQTDNYTYDADSTFKQTRIGFEYDVYGNPTKVTSQGDVEVSGDEKTQITEYTYNTTDWLLSFPKHTYLLDSQLTKVSEKWFYYDNSASVDSPATKGLLTKEEVLLSNPLTTTYNLLPTTYSYDSYGNLTQVTDALGRATTTEYDTLTQSYPVKVTNALGQSANTVYYGINESSSDTITGSGLVGQVKYTQDLNNQKTYNIYDKLGRIIKVIGPNDTEDYPGVSYEYDLTCSPIKVTKKLRFSYDLLPTSYYLYYSFFDGLGRLLQTKSPAEADPQTAQPRQIISDIVKFDSRGQIKEKYLPYYLSPTTDNLEQYVVPTYDTLYTNFNYDCLGRLIKVTNPDETSSSVTYSDWVTTSVDENGHSKTQYLDAYGKIIKIEEQNATQTYTTTYQYDTLGNLTQVTDNQNNTTQIWYDSLGRKIKMDDPDMGVWTYEYDLVGNLIKQTDAKAQVLTFEYDVLNRLSAKRSTLNANPVTIAYIYDEVSKTNCIGRLSKITDSSGSTEFFYDNLGREIKSVKKVNSSEFIVQREYDCLDRLTKLTYPDNSVVQYAYNPQGIERVYETTSQRVNESTNYISNIDYGATGQITKITYGNGTETNYTYDPKTLRLTNLITQSPQGKIQDLNYQFDNVGNITQLTDYVNTATQSFVYDDLDRLTQAQGSYGTFTYGYDSIGNLLNKEGMLLNYGEGSAGPHAVTSYTLNATRYTLSYDANGNMLKKGSLEYTYDIENRLAKVEDKSDEVEESVEIFLSHGWNFFSLPVIPADTKIASVLGSIQGKYDQVSRYNSTTKKFEHFVNNQKFNQFDTLEYLRGYQIYITDTKGALLKLTGKLPKTHSLSLKAGYNLISCPKTKEVGIEESLKPLKLGVDYSKIYRYNKNSAPAQGAGGSSIFEKFDSSSRGFSTLKPGESYYLYCLRDTTWTISNSQPTTTFTYDGDGGRVRKQITDNRGQSTETIYIGSLYETTNQRDNESTITKHIFSGANRICTINSTNSTNPINSINYFHSDHLGSSNVITDKDGKQVQYCEYTPYGSFSADSTNSTNATNSTNHYFTGKELDSTTDLYFYGARYYDPQLGRFITADTIVQAPYDPQSLNRYSYCRNNPINYVDPTGNKWDWKKFRNSFIGAFVGAVITMLTAGAGAPLWLAGMAGGFFGGGITGGLEGGWKGALIGAGIGATLGGIGGWGVDKFGWQFAAGMIAAGAGVAGATDSWDSFAGGMVGMVVGWGAGSGITSAYKEQFANFRAGEGFISNKDLIIAKIKSGEINWRTVVSYFNDPSTPVTVKSDLIDLMNSYGFNLQEQSSGVWSQTWQQATKIEPGAGIKLTIKANTTLTARYLSGDLYGLNSTKAIGICWGDVNFQAGALSSAKISFSYSTNRLTVMESNMKGPFKFILDYNAGAGWDLGSDR